MTPGFVAIGHVVRDLQPEGWRIGGTVTFAAVQAHRLGVPSAIVSRHAGDVDLARDLPDIDVLALPSEVSTSFQNLYEGSDRQQLVLQQADSLSPDDIPGLWRSAPIILFGPVCTELSSGARNRFPQSLVGVSAQGWLREVGPDNRVRRVAWNGEPFWTGCDALFVSEEDLGEHPEQVERWVEDVPVLAVTRAGRGARIHADGTWRDIDGFPAQELDPTGAGDVFAAAFLVRYHESRQFDEAARFASAAAACSIEGTGTEAIASRDMIEERMARHPDITVG